MNLSIAKEIKVASYNVENLFDLRYDGSEYAEYIPNTKWQWNSKNYKKKLNNISKVISDVNPDIIALQEIESLQALMDLRKALKMSGAYYKYYAIAKAKNTNIKNAILSKIPIDSSKEISVTSSRRYRNILEATFNIDGEKLYIFVNHSKAKSGSESKRIISAKALKKRLNELGDKNILLVGDFNSDYDEYKNFLKSRKLNDTNGKTALQHTLQSVDENDNHITLHSLKHPYYYNPWIEIDKSRMFTHKFRKYRHALDHILISSALHNKSGLEYKVGSFNRYDKSYVLKRNAPFRWQRSRYAPYHHTGKGFSDHLLVHVTLNTN